MKRWCPTREDQIYILIAAIVFGLPLYCGLPLRIALIAHSAAILVLLAWHTVLWLFGDPGWDDVEPAVVLFIVTILLGILGLALQRAERSARLRAIERAKTLMHNPASSAPGSTNEPTHAEPALPKRADTRP